MGSRCRVMSSSTLNFGNAVEVTPTLQPTSASDNRFEFAASGSRNFYRLEPNHPAPCFLHPDGWLFVGLFLRLNLFAFAVPVFR